MVDCWARLCCRVDFIVPKKGEPWEPIEVTLKFISMTAHHTAISPEVAMQSCLAGNRSFVRLQQKSRVSGLISVQFTTISSTL